MSVAGSGKEPLRVETALDADLARAEIDMYLGTDGMAEIAGALEARAEEADLISRARRARLLGSDARSRRGELEDALRLQLETLTEAELDADRMVCARAHCLLAATYDRLAEQGKALQSAEECVRLLVPEDPPNWHAEHMGVLALATSYWRHGDPDYTTFDEAIRLAQDLGEPVLLLAIMNNYVYTAVTRGDERSGEMTEELRRLAEREMPDGYPSAWLDTIAFGLMNAGKLDEAAAYAAAAVEAAPRDHVEPTTFAMCIITQAKIERARGNVVSAVERATAALTLARAAGVNESIGRALEELSELAAENRDYKLAYEYLRERNQALDLFQTERSELHAVTLQAIYSVEVERQQRLALEALADTDPLTGLYNRRYMNRQLAQLVQGSVALALIDIDHFKRINDRFGHEAGDRVLTRLALTLQAHVDALDHEAAFAARIGGEEFVLALPGVGAASARERCERVRAEVEGCDWDEIAPRLRVTVSIGLATLPFGGGAPSALLSRADAQLYNAKRQGRNRVISEELHVTRRAHRLWGMQASEVKFDADGLVPCIVQDWNSGEVLTLAYMNAEALALTIETAEMHFFSRSRQELWHKGATSGNSQQLKGLRYDCDADAVLALIEPAGPACHTGERTCFYRGDLQPQAPFEVLPELERTIAARRSETPDVSYTAALLADPDHIGQKVQEEAEEVARAAREEPDERVANEAADVLYHLSVLLASRSLTLADAGRVLDERRR